MKQPCGPAIKRENIQLANLVPPGAHPREHYVWGQSKKQSPKDTGRQSGDKWHS